jgi:hypothetical protein
LTLNLTNPSGSVVNLLGTSADAPTDVVMDGATVPMSTSLSAYQDETGDAWYYDAGNQKLYLQDKQSGTTSGILVAFGASAGDDPPSVPTGV